MAKPSSLAGKAMLEKIDKLFQCNIGSYIDLPQIVVVGDQSSGKSSVLESLTDLPFPKDSGLCTRFATQITFRRNATEGISIEIIPGKDANGDHARKLRAWSKKGLPTLDQATFATVMHEVHEVMGLASTTDGESASSSIFTNDVLSIHVSGPTQDHLSVIDVPGIFKNPQPPVTESDMRLVENMVMGYMKNPRSVLLTVIPANVDIATQSILQSAKSVDPDGQRTLGVLTKPDLVDKGAEFSVIALIEGHKQSLKLGWSILKNPGQAQANDRLQNILFTHIRREFPKVKSEINKRLAEKQAEISNLGPSRTTASEQRACMIAIGTKFQNIASAAVSANYSGDNVFNDHPELKIATWVRNHNDAFSKNFEARGHKFQFRTGHEETEAKDNHDEEHGKEKKQAKPLKPRSIDTPLDLEDFLQGYEPLQEPKRSGISEWITEIYTNSRGFELGTFNASLLSTLMQSQTENWEALSLGYISDIIALTHTFVDTLLKVVCPDEQLRSSIKIVLMDNLLARYKMALGQVEFILKVERFGDPLTVNKYFNSTMETIRQERIKKELTDKSFNVRTDGADHDRQARSMTNTEHVVQELHDILSSYYKVASKRVVDIICMQAASFHLVSGPDTPLTLFSPTWVGELTDEQLEEIAGEDPTTKSRREQLQKECEDLEKGKKILF
ncbi:P-loop containing nucleoside triphosphate hydrolase protein [Phyllosticta capitalensis]|uniref:P-loop containing nucleoside triphosphate hydrolase protein n=1 Tax=Phyllosticta capitalensis TaxID=121624 RepID=UPI003132915A